MSVAEMAEWARGAEDSGYEIMFFSATIALMCDSVSALSMFASRTSRITLASTQVVRLRSPVVDGPDPGHPGRVSGGRIVLALGACTRSHAEHHSLEHLDRVLTLTEDGAIRGLLAHRPASYHGEAQGHQTERVLNLFAQER